MKKIVFWIFVAVFWFFVFSVYWKDATYQQATIVLEKLDKKISIYPEQKQKIMWWWIQVVLGKFKDKNRDNVVLVSLVWYLEVLIDSKLGDFVEPVFVKNIAENDVVKNIKELLLDAVNKERKKHWLSLLIFNEKLSKAAQWHAEYMDKTDDFAHTTKWWKTMVDRINSVKYVYSAVAENIAWWQTSVDSVMVSWMNSKWHRENILWEPYCEIGIGISGKYWVQVFGSSY